MVFENARQYVRGDRIDDLEDLGVVFVHCIEVGVTTSIYDLPINQLSCFYLGFFAS